MQGDEQHQLVQSGQAVADPIPAFAGGLPTNLRDQMTKAVRAWMLRTPSPHTRRAYESDLGQFLADAGIQAGAWEQLASVRPEHVAAWRDRLAEGGMTNSSIRRKMTALRSLFSYLKTYGYTGANPAHSDFVTAPAVSRDGKTVGLSPHDCRRLLEAPLAQDHNKQVIPVGIRDQAMIAVLSYSACRVGELIKLRVRDFRTNGEHRVLNITGKGNKERTTPLHLEAVEKLAAWLAMPGIGDNPAAPLFRPQKSVRGNGRDGFRLKPMTTRAVEKLIERYVTAVGLDTNVTVHSLRVTALTTARERGSDIIDGVNPTFEPPAAIRHPKRLLYMLDDLSASEGRRRHNPPAFFPSFSELPTGMNASASHKPLCPNNSGKFGSPCSLAMVPTTWFSASLRIAPAFRDRSSKPSSNTSHCNESMCGLSRRMVFPISSVKWLMRLEALFSSGRFLQIARLTWPGCNTLGIIHMIRQCFLMEAYPFGGAVRAAPGK